MDPVISTFPKILYTADVMDALKVNMYLNFNVILRTLHPYQDCQYGAHQSLRVDAHYPGDEVGNEATLSQSLLALSQSDVIQKGHK